MLRWGLAFCLLLCIPAGGWGQACTHYASTSGSGSGSCPIGTPCTITRFWQLAAPGHVLCLNDGTYTAENIEPPNGLAGTSGNPITVRALNDGAVTIDAQHGGFAVWLSSGRSNNWFVIDGINAKNGLEAVYRVTGNDNILRRVIGWDGTSGQADSNIFAIGGQRNRIEDCAGWGMNSRKIFDVAQSGNVGGSGFARCWGEWNDHPQGESQPNNTWLTAYNTSNARFYNILGTWRGLGQVGNAESILEMAMNCDENYDVEGTAVRGALMYVTPGAAYQPDKVVSSFCTSNGIMEDVIAYVPSGYSGVAPFQFFDGGSLTASNNACNNCLAVHNGTASSNAGDSGWTLNDFREGNSLAAATGGASAFVLLPGLCMQYDSGGTITETPLWPWAMNQRILDARAASGFAAVDVTATVESLLGTIPAACRSDSAPGTAFLAEATNLDVTAAATIVFLSEATGLDVTATGTVAFAGEVIGVDVTGTATIVFLSEATGLSVSQP